VLSSHRSTILATLNRSSASPSASDAPSQCTARGQDRAPAQTTGVSVGDEAADDGDQQHQCPERLLCWTKSLAAVPATTARTAWTEAGALRKAREQIMSTGTYTTDAQGDGCHPRAGASSVASAASTRLEGWRRRARRTAARRIPPRRSVLGGGCVVKIGLPARGNRNLPTKAQPAHARPGTTE
jgi:hypothetical protein